MDDEVLYSSVIFSQKKQSAEKSENKRTTGLKEDVIYAHIKTKKSLNLQESDIFTTGDLGELREADEDSNPYSTLDGIKTEMKTSESKSGGAPVPPTNMDNKAHKFKVLLFFCVLLVTLIVGLAMLYLKQKEDMTALEVQYVELDKNHTSLHFQCGTLNKSHTSLQSQCGTLNKSHTSLQSQCSELDKNHTSLHFQCGTLNKSHTSLQSQCGTLSKSHTSLQSQCSELDKNHTSLQSQYKKLNERVTALNKVCPIRDTSVQGLTCFACPQSWLLFSSHCYLYYTDKKNWNKSQERCTSVGGHLVIIETKEEQDFLVAMMEINGGNEKTYWIGLTDQVTEGHFLWVDNKPLEKQFWGRREHNNSLEPDNWTNRGKNPEGEDCVQLQILQKNKGWYDAKCDIKKKSICEAAAVSFSVST